MVPQFLLVLMVFFGQLFRFLLLFLQFYSYFTTFLCFFFFFLFHVSVACVDHTLFHLLYKLLKLGFFLFVLLKEVFYVLLLALFY